MLIKVLVYLKKTLKALTNSQYYIQNSMSSASVISNLTEDLLTLAKIKNNVFELNIEQNVNLLEVVYEAFQVLSFNAEQKDITFELEIQKDKRFLVQRVTADKRRILQILLNFISNSIKFTSQNGLIKVIIKVVSEKDLEGTINLNVDQIMNSGQINISQLEFIEKKVKIQIIIQDNGAGISKENLNKLFSNFGKLNEHKEMNLKGTGLGLSICKQIIEQMGGNVTVKSKVGIGSQFIIELEMEALDQVYSQIKDLQNSQNEIYSQKVIQNFLEIDRTIEEEIFIFSDQSDHSQIQNNNQYINRENKNVIFQFLNSKNKQNEGKKDQHLNIINNMIKKLKNNQLQMIQQSLNLQSQLNSSNGQIDQSQINQSIINKVNGSIVKNQFANDRVSQQSHQIQSMNRSNNQPSSKNGSIEKQLSLKKSVKSSNKSSQIQENNFKRERKSSIINIDSQSINLKKYIINQLEQEQEDDEIPYNRHSVNVDNLKSMHENASLNQIEEAYEQSSQFISESEKHSSNILSCSIQKSQKISLLNNVRIPEHFNEYLQNNQILRDAINISFKYNREKLQILVANDDSFQLFCIQTSLDKFQNVSLIHTAQNGEEALNNVKNNELSAHESLISSFFNVIFLDLDMPFMDGNEACLNIQQHYNSLRKKSLLQHRLHQQQELKSKMNTINEPQQFSESQNEDVEQWVVDLKKVYDMYQQIDQKQDFAQSISRENKIRLQDRLRQEILKVFNILYLKLRYKSLAFLNRPFMFAYSAFINQKIIDETMQNGFDKCIEAPLNQLKIEYLFEEYVEQYSFYLTNQLLEKIGPVPNLKEMINTEKLKNGNNLRSGSMYNSLFRFQEKSYGSQRQSSNEFRRQIYSQQDQQKKEERLENKIQQIEIERINEAIKEYSQSSECFKKQDLIIVNRNINQSFNDQEKSNNLVIANEEVKSSNDQFIQQNLNTLKSQYFQ